VGDFAENGFFHHIEANFYFHLGDIDVAVAFVCAVVYMVALGFGELRKDRCGDGERSDGQCRSE